MRPLKISFGFPVRVSVRMTRRPSCNLLLDIWLRNFVYPIIIIRPHRSTTYVDAAYCYRPSSVVCRFVCRSVTLVSRAKKFEAIEMPFVLRTWVGLKNHVLDTHGVSGLSILAHLALDLSVLH